MKTFDLVAILRRLYAIVIRRFALIVIPVSILTPGGYIVYKLMPRTYKSYTKILMAEPKTQQTLLAQVGSTSRINKRINLLINVVLSHNVLGQLAKYIAQKKKIKLTPRKLYQWTAGLRKKISIWNMGQGLVQLEYKSGDPKECLDHLKYLFGLFLKETTRPEHVAIKRSANFLAKQLAHLRTRLQKAETALTDFKRKHSLELPKTFRANLNNYLAISKKLFEDRQELLTATRRRNFLRQQLNQLDPSLVRVRKQILQMLALKIRLAGYLSRYTSRHPKVKRTRKRLRSIQRAITTHRLRRMQTLKQLKQTMKPGRFVPGSKRNGSKGERPGPLSLFDKYQETVFRIAVLKQQLQENKNQFNKLKKQLADYPLREQQLNELTRDVTISRTIYTKVRTLHEQSLLQRELDIFDATRRVRVIEPAALPLYPIAPKFILVVGGAIFAAFAFSALLIGFAELFDPTYTGDEEVTELLGVDVIGEVKELPQIIL